MAERHDKAAALLKLARLLASSTEGLTLDEMAREMGVGRRTVERMRNAVGVLFPNMEDEPDGSTKRFRITNGFDGLFQAPTLDEIAELVKARNAARGRDDRIAAAQLDSLLLKIQAALKSPARNRMAPDLETIMQAEAIAVQPGPRPAEDPAILNALRSALLGGSQASFRYEGGTKAGSRRTVVPYGLVFGEEVYLVAREAGEPEEAEPRLWKVGRMAEAQVADAPGLPPEDFRLDEYAAQSFGVFQEPPSDVTLHILPQAAAEARAYRFHPHQRIEPQDDGSLLIHMRAGGLRELAWKLVRWGDTIRIVQPDRLKAEMATWLDLARRQID